MTRSCESTRYSKRFLNLSVVAAVALGGASTLVAGPARADTVASASDLESARGALLAGRALRAKGDLAGALEKFKAAHVLAHTPVTGIELAKAHAELGQPVEARDVCFEIGRMPIGVGETSRSREARAEANTLAEAMQGKVATLLVVLKATPGRATVVRVDGVEVPEAALAAGRKVNPGKHVVTARIDEGPEASVSATLGEGEKKTVELAPEAPKQVARGGPMDPPPQPPPAVVERKTLSPLVPIGFGVGAAGLVVGSVAGIVAMSKKATLDSECKTPTTTPGLLGCDSGQGLSSARAVATVSTVGFVVAGVGAAVGIVGLLTPGTVRVGKQGRISPYFDGMGAGVHGAF